MLVLTRKVGQQILLPESGITIDVVNIGKRQVRLGIVAPSQTPVHRKEVWDRIHVADAVPPERTSESAAHGWSLHAESDGTNSGSTMAQSSDIRLRLAYWIARRTAGRVCQLAVTIDDDRLIISGATPSYHVRQLVQAAVTEVLSTRKELASSEIEYRIEVHETSQ